MRGWALRTDHYAGIAMIRNGRGGQWEQMIENGQLRKEPKEIYVKFS